MCIRDSCISDEAEKAESLEEHNTTVLELSEKEAQQLEKKHTQILTSAATKNATITIGRFMDATALPMISPKPLWSAIL